MAARSACAIVAILFLAAAAVAAPGGARVDTDRGAEPGSEDPVVLRLSLRHPTTLTEALDFLETQSRRVPLLRVAYGPSQEHVEQLVVSATTLPAGLFMLQRAVNSRRYDEVHLEAIQILGYCGADNTTFASSATLVLEANRPADDHAAQEVRAYLDGIEAPWTLFSGPMASVDVSYNNTGICAMVRAGSPVGVVHIEETGPEGCRSDYLACYRHNECTCYDPQPVVLEAPLRHAGGISARPALLAGIAMGVVLVAVTIFVAVRRVRSTSQQARSSRGFGSPGIPLNVRAHDAAEGGSVHTLVVEYDEAELPDTLEAINIANEMSTSTPCLDSEEYLRSAVCLLHRAVRLSEDSESTLVHRRDRHLQLQLAHAAQAIAVPMAPPPSAAPPRVDPHMSAAANGAASGGFVETLMAMTDFSGLPMPQHPQRASMVTPPSLDVLPQPWDSAPPPPLPLTERDFQGPLPMLGGFPMASAPLEFGAFAMHNPEVAATPTPASAQSPVDPSNSPSSPSPSSLTGHLVVPIPEASGGGGGGGSAPASMVARYGSSSPPSGGSGAHPASSPSAHSPMDEGSAAAHGQSDASSPSSSQHVHQNFCHPFDQHGAQANPNMSCPLCNERPARWSSGRPNFCKPCYNKVYNDARAFAKKRVDDLLTRDDELLIQRFKGFLQEVQHTCRRDFNQAACNRCLTLRACDAHPVAVVRILRNGKFAAGNR